MPGPDWIVSEGARPGDLTACILAGGLGTRLRPAVSDRPKPMAAVDGRPFLSRILERLAAAGIPRAVLCTGYMGDKVSSDLGDRSGSMRLVYSREDRPLGTAGALRLALPHLGPGPVLVLNGDSFCEFDATAFLGWHRAKQATASLLLSHASDCSRYGSVTLADDESVATFEEKGSASGPGWINAGVYLLAPTTIAEIPEGTPVSLERDVFPSLVGRGLYGMRLEGGTFIDIGTPESYARASEFFASLAPVSGGMRVGLPDGRSRGEDAHG